MDDRSKRRRAAGLMVRRFESARDAERHDLAYWLSLSPDQRLEQVWRLSVDLWRWRGEYRDERGLCRSVASVRRT